MRKIPHLKSPAILRIMPGLYEWWLHLEGSMTRIQSHCRSNPYAFRGGENKPNHSPAQLLPPANRLKNAVAALDYSGCLSLFVSDGNKWHGLFNHYPETHITNCAGTGALVASTWTPRPLYDFAPTSSTGTGIDGLTFPNSTSFILPEGVYDISCEAAAYQVLRTRLRLQNTTDSTTVIAGVNATTAPAARADQFNTYASLIGRFTIAAGKTLRIEQWATLSVPGNGMGVTSFTTSYATLFSLRIRKVKHTASTRATFTAVAPTFPSSPLDRDNLPLPIVPNDGDHGISGILNANLEQASDMVQFPPIPHYPTGIPATFGVDHERTIATVFNTTTNTHELRIINDSLSSAAVGTNFAGVSAFVVADEKSSGTAGGATSAVGFMPRAINAVRVALSGCSLASNQITLPAGTWNCEVVAVTWCTGKSQLKLANVTDTTTLLEGQSMTAIAGDASGTVPALPSTTLRMNGRFTLAAPKVLSIQQYVGTVTSTSNDLGPAASTGQSEVYLIAVFTPED